MSYTLLFALEILAFLLAALLAVVLVRAKNALVEIAKISDVLNEIHAVQKNTKAALPVLQDISDQISDAAGSAGTAVTNAETAVDEATHRHERDHPPC